MSKLLELADDMASNIAHQQFAMAEEDRAALVAEVERMEAEIAALREDAERYRWLCEFTEWPEPVGAAMDCGIKLLIDDAIDAARGKQ